MTEKYGSEAETHEAGAEHEAAHEGDAWHGDQPPVDDFADGEHAGAEGAATVSEETEVAENVVEDEPKKKSSLGMFVILIGIILAGGMVYYQFFGGAAMLKPHPVAVASKPPSLPIAALPVTAPSVASAPLMPTPVAQPTPVTASNDISNLKSPSTAPAPQPAPVMPATPSVAMPSPSMPSPSMPSALDQAPSAIPAGGGVESQIGALTARIDTLQKSLDEANQQVTQLNGMVTALQGAPAGPPATASMEDRLNKIEQDVLKLQQSPAASTAMAKPLPVPAEAIKAPAHHTKPKASVAAKSAPHPATKPTPAADVVPAVTVMSVSWVLRAATPGEAWVSQGAGSSNLKHVQVGDDLPGIGHVTAIRQDQGRWVVEGSKGTIR